MSTKNMEDKISAKMEYNPYDADSIIELWKDTISNLNILNDDVIHALESKIIKKSKKQCKQLKIIRDLLEEMSLDDGLDGK